MNERTEPPLDGLPPPGPSELPHAAPDEPHPAEAHALEFDALDGAAPGFRASVLPFPARARDGTPGDGSSPEQPWSAAVAQARVRLLELEA